MIQTTLAKLKEHGPCEGGWKKLLENLGGYEQYGQHSPVTLLQILDSNGLDDALCALRACGDKRFTRLLACDYAEHVLHLFEDKYPDDKRPRQAIEVSRRYADGKATDEELAAAWADADAAWAVAWDDGANAAVWAPVWVAAAAAWAAEDPDWAAGCAAAAVAAYDAAAAAGCAAGAFACAAAVAARAKARAAEERWQEERLRELLEAEKSKEILDKHANKMAKGDDKAVEWWRQWRSVIAATMNALKG